MRLMPRRGLLIAGTAAGAAALIVAVALVVVTQVGIGSAQSTSPTTVNQYASKFLCGPIASPASPYSVLAPGVYNTAVNIHNPNNFDVYIQKKAVVSAIEPNQGLPGQRQTHILRPDASMEVDCAEIFSLLTSANPVCPTPGVTLFCKGYMVTEAARQVLIAGQVKYVAAQLDVTDIITVKEEDGIWKDYTFKVLCVNPGGCLPVPNYRFDTPYNWPDRPVSPPCYNDYVLQCNVYDVDQVIKQRVDQDCGGCGVIYQPDYAVQLLFTNFSTDSRDVALDYEFVSPKLINYPCWPKGNAACQ